MHAMKIVTRFIEGHLQAMHASRRGALAVAVLALMHGHALSLSRLARAVMGAGRLKAALKRMDRLIGNRRIEQEACAVGQALLGVLVKMNQPLIIAVDWSAVAPGGQFMELRASVSIAGMGRGLTVYQQVYEQKRFGTPQAESQLLARLGQWLGSYDRVTVVMLSDAGFRQPWFACVQALGWQWIGRVRRGTRLGRDEQHWLSIAQCFAQASAKAQRWADCLLSRAHRFRCDVVLYRSPSRGRKHYGRPGHGGTPKAQREARLSAREPWVLAHSVGLRHCRADEIVAMYARRMQIEENFRDTKAPLLGMGLAIARSRSAQRLQGLMMIGTLASFLLWHIGQLAEAEGLDRRFKATTRDAREQSIISVALFICRTEIIWLSPPGTAALLTRLHLRS